MRIVELRSDTKTLPTPAMRESMATSQYGDDMVGDDPTVNRLEEMAADMLGKEAGLLLSSGTMGNLVPILALCQRGDDIIIGDKSHIYRAEAGGASALGGVAYHPIPNLPDGTLDPDEVEVNIHPADQHYSPTRLIALENTHNSCNGRALTSDEIASVAVVAHEYDIPLHIDGARLFNAAVALETPPAELVKDADTVTFCLSKGLGCPAGSLLVGDHETIDKARKVRKMLGGAMRQAGIIAAPGIVALETMIDRLADDHANARKLARGLATIPGFEIDPGDVHTNLVFVTTTDELPAGIAGKLAEQGIMVGDRGNNLWRLVTHNDVLSDDIDHALDVIETTVRESMT